MTMKETSLIFPVLIDGEDVSMCLLPVTVAVWWQLAMVVQAMLEDPVGYSVLYDSIPEFGLLFLENPWVWGWKVKYSKAMKRKDHCPVHMHFG